MLNLTFLYETCDKTEIQFIHLCENKVCVYSEGMALVLNQASLHTCAV